MRTSNANVFFFKCEHKTKKNGLSLLSRKKTMSEFYINTFLIKLILIFTALKYGFFKTFLFQCFRLEADFIHIFQGLIKFSNLEFEKVFTLFCSPTTQIFLKKQFRSSNAQNLFRPSNVVLQKQLDLKHESIVSRPPTLIFLYFLKFCTEF